MKSLFVFTTFFTSFSLFYLTSPPHRCGYHIRNDRGYIATPNFPKPYPVPIACQWVIEAPPNCKIAVYFTQFYLKTGFRASEFALYMADIGVGVSKSDFGVISSKDEPTYLMSNQRILVLDLHVYSLDNVHLRVTEHLLETYGFNITYEVLQKNESVRQDACIYHHCSFTGFCLASKDLKEYRCECVSGYFGEECQYDFDCGPTATSNVCYNGGTCRYYIGSSVRTCECPSGFEGAKCEISSELKNATDDTEESCDVKHYTSHPHYIPIYPGEKKCPPKGEDLYIIRANLTISENTKMEMLDLKNAMEQLILKRLDFLLLNEVNITFFDENKNEVVIRFLVEHGSLEMRQTIKKRLMHLENGNYSIQMMNTDLQIQPTLQIERMEISEKMPIMEGVPLLIACIVRGGPNIRVKWLKDGSPIMFPEVHGRLWNSTIPKNSFDSFTFLLGFDKTFYLDSGILTCIAEDEIHSDHISITVTVKQLAKPLLNPLSATVRAKDLLTITCVSQEVHKDQSVTYFWTRNDRPLLRIREQVEDLFPSGSRLILKEALESANYTCAIHVLSSVRKETSVINVVSDEDFASSTCHRETFLDINWRITAVGIEDFHVCQSNYKGYIFRKCLKADNQTAIWQEPDFSRCLSDDFLKIKNGFESYSMGYRINTLNFLLEKMFKTLTDSISALRMSEAEPLMDILSDVDIDLYLREDAAENWKIILNTISMLLNSTSISRKQIKQKMYYFIRNMSLSYGKQYLSNNSSREFVSPTLLVKVWKIGRDFQDFLSFPGDEQLSWSSNSLELELKVCNNSDLEGNSSITVSMVVYKSHIFAGIEKFPGNYVGLTLVDDFMPLTTIEAKGEANDGSVPIKVLLTYKYLVRTRKKTENIGCYKIPMLESITDIRSCEKVEISGEDVVCQCFISSFLSVVLLEKQNRLAKVIPLSLKFKILPMIGVVISIVFLLYTFGILGCKKRFASLFE